MRLFQKSRKRTDRHIGGPDLRPQTRTYVKKPLRIPRFCTAPFAMKSMNANESCEGRKTGGQQLDQSTKLISIDSKHQNLAMGDNGAALKLDLPKDNLSIDHSKSSQPIDNSKSISVSDNSKLLSNENYAVETKVVGDSSEKQSVRFMDDLAAQLLSHSGAGPGNFLSRSQDNLVATVAARRRKPITTPSTTIVPVGSSGNRRPVSSLGLPKVGSSGNMFGNSKSTRTASSAAQLSQIRKSSLQNGEVLKTKESGTSSLKTGVIQGTIDSKSRKSPAASQQVADARITKTKLTVTELQKHKQDLEQQVSDLVQKAELKQAELATLKMEVRHLKEERDKELENLQRENDRLRLRLRTISPDIGDQTLLDEDATLTDSLVKGTKTFVDVGTSPASFRAVRRSTAPIVEDAAADSADSSDILFGSPQATGIVNEGGAGGEPCIPSSTRVTADWDRQSVSSMSEVSLACLQDRIVQMEENHYSTNEELQATLQELTDLQDIVNELTKENTQLAEEKSMLLDSLYNQTQKLNNCRLQIENLKHLLLSSTQFRSAHCKGGGSSSARSPTTADHPDDYAPEQRDYQLDQDQVDREQQLVDLLKNTHEEHEELANKYDEVRAALKLANEEKVERTEMVEMLRDRARLLENQIETLSSEKKSFEDQLRESKQQVDRDRREIVRLTNVYEKERCRVEELLRQSNSKAGKDEMQNLLDKLRTEKAAAEDRVNALEEMLNKKTHEIDDLRHKCEKLETDLRFSHSEAEKTILILEERIRDQEREGEYLKKQTMELRANNMELDERCQRHLDDKKEYRANIITLQKTVDDLTAEKERLKRQLLDEQTLREQEAEEWRQFQADLQVAVVVANDFKIEAQNDIERLATENTQLRDRLATLSGELEKLRTNRNSPTGSSMKIGASKSSTPPTSTTTPCPDIRSRMEGYLTSVERSTMGLSGSGSPSSSSTTSSTTTGFDSCRSRKYSATIEPMKGLSVKALVESLENTGNQPSAMTFRTAAPMLRSPGSNRHSSITNGNSATASGNGASVADAQLSKSSGHLACRPISMDSVEGLLAKQPIKTAASETEMQALAPVTLRGSPLKKTTAPVPDVVMNAQTAAIDATTGGQAVKPKGILLTRGSASNNNGGRRSGVYLTTDSNDPLGKLMKDAPRGSRRNALLRWCQMKTAGYSGVEITNFSSSWNDGLAFCALLHSLVPEKIPYKSFDAKDKRRNFTVAFETAADLGIPPSLNVDDMLSLERPDWQSVMSYVTAIYKHFEG